MKITIRAHGDVKRTLGGQTRIVELEDGAKIRDLILKLGGRVKGTTGASLGVYRLVDSAIVVLVNGRNIHALDGIDTALREGDLVTFMPVIVGG